MPVRGQCSICGDFRVAGKCSDLFAVIFGGGSTAGKIAGTRVVQALPCSHTPSAGSLAAPVVYKPATVNSTSQTIYLRLSELHTPSTYQTLQT